MKREIDSEILAILASCAKSPKRALTMAQAAAKKAKKKADGAATLDALADACLAKGDAKHAGQAWNAARALVKDAPAARWRRMAGAGALETRDVVAFIGGGPPKKDAVHIAVENVVHGRPPTPELVAALQKRRALAPVLTGWARSAEPGAIGLDVWAAAKGELAALVAEEPSARRHVLAMLNGDGGADALSLVAAASVAESVQGDAARELGEAAMRVADADGTEQAFGPLEQILSAIARGAPAPLSIIQHPAEDGEVGAESWNRHLVDAGVVELALSLGVPLRIPQGDARSHTFSLYRWADRKPCPRDELRRVAAHPFFGEVLAASFLPGSDKDSVGNWLARAVTIEGGFQPVFSALDALGAKLHETWTVGALATHESWMDGVCQPAVLARCPALARAVRELDPARLLRNQLRAGIMDEWGWPAQEEALSRFAEAREREVSPWATSGPLPYKVLLDQKEGRVVAYGPEGVVLDRDYPAAKEMKDVRRLLYLSGDVLVCEYHPYQARWVVDGGEPLQVDPFGVFQVGCDGAAITRALTLLRRGDRGATDAPPPGNRNYRVWCDGDGYYAVLAEVRLRADGSKVDSDFGGIERFDPHTGQRLGRALPPWMAEVVGDGVLIADIQASFICPVPAGAEESPLGARSGLGGSALYRRGGGEIRIRGIDGREASGIVNGLHAVALMTFPERDGFYPIVQSAFSLGVAMPDGTTPLIPMDQIKGSYWAGTPELPLLDWHSLRPRDRAGSRALARTGDEAAQAIYRAATAPTMEPEEVTRYGDMLAVKQAEEVDEAIPRALLDVVARALPEVKHRRMIAGVAGVARAAAGVAPIITRLKTRAPAAGASRAKRSSLRNEDVAALSRLFQHDRHWWIEKLGTQLGQQILDVSRFLFDPSLEERVVTPAPTVVPWPLLLVRVGEVLYRVLAPGTPKARREELVKALELWLETEFPSRAGSVRLVDLSLPQTREELAGLDREHPQRLVAWESRFYLQWNGAKDGRMFLHGIEAASTGGFALPEGAALLQAQPADARFDAARIRRALALFAERGAAPFDAGIAEAIAERTKLSKTAATLLWSAGYDPWLIGEKKMGLFGVDRDSLDDAEKELKPLPLHAIYARAMPDDPAEMYDSATMAGRIAAAFAGLASA
jgi:hypothetical protein